MKHPNKMETPIELYLRKGRENELAYREEKRQIENEIASSGIISLGEGFDEEKEFVELIFNLDNSKDHKYFYELRDYYLIQLRKHLAYYQISGVLSVDNLDKMSAIITDISNLFFSCDSNAVISLRTLSDYKEKYSLIENIKSKIEEFVGLTSPLYNYEYRRNSSSCYIFFSERGLHGYSVFLYAYMNSIHICGVPLGIGRADGKNYTAKKFLDHDYLHCKRYNVYIGDVKRCYVSIYHRDISNDWKRIMIFTLWFFIHEDAFLPKTIQDFLDLIGMPWHTKLCQNFTFDDSQNLWSPSVKVFLDSHTFLEDDRIKLVINADSSKIENRINQVLLMGFSLFGEIRYDDFLCKKYDVPW